MNTALLTSAQMRAIEQTAIESGQVSGRELMELAGQAVVEAVGEAWPSFAPAAIRDNPLRALILCGPGNNGGDGFVIARLLHARGWNIQLGFYGTTEKLPPDARANYERWCETGDVMNFKDPDVLSRFERPDLIVDALFGTGLSRSLPEDLKTALSFLQIAATPNAAIPWVAVDIPSGLCADTGQDLGGAPRVDLTVTFHRAKLGHYLAGADGHCGQLVVKPIGLADTQPPDAVTRVTQVPSKRLSKITSAHKFHHGHALVLSGGFGRSGAARLAAKAALRIGAGLVTLGVPADAAPEVAGQITALMMVSVSSRDDLLQRLTDPRINALCLGPGLGHDRARELVPVALHHKIGCVLDADALSAFSADPDALFKQLHARCVLTPHAGEFARLFPDLAQSLAASGREGPIFSKVDAVRAAAQQAGCVVLFKGADTVIAAPDGRCALHAASYDRATPWLATAGAGDVLAGLICGLITRGLPAFVAAQTGAWVHAEAARRFGPGLIAEDIEGQIPAVLRDLGVV